MSNTNNTLRSAPSQYNAPPFLSPRDIVDKNTPAPDRYPEQPFIKALQLLALSPEKLPRTDVILLGTDPVAEGQFGAIWKGTHHGDIVAVKILKRYSRSDPTKYVKQILHETRKWRPLRHPNIHQFLFLCEAKANRGQIGMVSRWMENGNLRDFLSLHRDVDRTSLTRDIAEGLEYLHTRKPSIVHHDLKSVNILITPEHRACITDYAHGGGTWRWMAPEIFESDERHKSTAIDVYAYGHVVYEIFSGNIPFHDITNDYRVVIKVIEGQRPPRPVRCNPHGIDCGTIGLNDEIWAIVEHCWAHDPACRPTMSEVLTRLSTRTIPSCTVKPRPILWIALALAFVNSALLFWARKRCEVFSWTTFHAQAAEATATAMAA